MGYTVHLRAFEGPLDLLLQLIEDQEIDIYQIPIAQITRQYLQALEEMESLDLEVASEFLVLAATLIQIKVRLLLPQPEPSTEEEGEDPREELVQRLLEYKRYKELAQSLNQQAHQFSGIYSRQELNRAFLAGLRPSPDPKDVDVEISQLVAAFRAVWEAGQVEPRTYEVEREEINLREERERIYRLFSLGRPVTFTEIVGERPSRGLLVVSFLIVLEMVRRGSLRVRQEGVGAQIWLYPTEGETVFDTPTSASSH